MIEPAEISKVGVGLRIGVKELVHDSNQLTRIISSALENGINLIDIVNTIGIGRVEKRVNKALQKLDCRDELFIITKGGVQWDSNGVMCPDGDPENIKKSVRYSLQLLGIDTIDCYQIYWPDEEVPFAETLAALEELKQEGLIRYTGVTNFSVEQIEKASQGGTIDFAQFPYSIFQRQAQKKLLPYCQSKNINTLAYGVLCRGLLTDDFLEKGDLEFDTMQSSLAHVRDNFPLFRQAVHEIADYLKSENISAPLASSLIAWTLSHQGISRALVVAHNVEQVNVIARALQINLRAEQLEKITAITDKIIGKNLGKDFITPPRS